MNTPKSHWVITTDDTVIATDAKRGMTYKSACDRVDKLRAEFPHIRFSVAELESYTDAIIKLKEVSV